MTEKQIDHIGRVLRALTDPTRLRIIWLLQTHGELAVKDVCLILRLEQSGVSHKLAKMSHLNMVKSRRIGQRVCYSLVDPLAISQDLVLQLGRAIIVDPAD